MRALVCFALSLTGWICSANFAAAQQWVSYEGSTYTSPAYSSYYYTAPTVASPVAPYAPYSYGYPATYYNAYPAYYYGYPRYYYSGYSYGPFYGRGLWLGGRRFGLGIRW